MIQSDSISNRGKDIYHVHKVHMVHKKADGVSCKSLIY